MNANTHEFQCGSKQSSNAAATYAQLQYLEKFENVSINCPSSAFTTRFTKSEASEMIELAKTGATVIVNR